ncbi:hypothetical protein S245_060509, partial [Arachis hypogaea]
MSLTIDPVQKISPWKETWSIEAKILTIWKDASIVNENMQKLLHVVLMDKQVNKVSLQNVINVSRVSINRDMQETVNFLNEYHIASHHFSRLCSDENGDLVCVIDDESFDWKLIRTIANLKGNNEKIEHPYCPQFFHQLIGKEIVFKVQAKWINSLGYCGTFKIINVISDARFFNKLQSDQCIKDVSSDSAFSPILEDFSRCGQLRSYDNQVISGVPIQLHSIKEMLADILCAKIYFSASRN